jgi:hypothetical protein
MLNNARKPHGLVENLAARALKADPQFPPLGGKREYKKSRGSTAPLYDEGRRFLEEAVCEARSDSPRREAYSQSRSPGNSAEFQHISM